MTEAIGAALASILPDGATVHLRGEVGAGKTTLVRGAARAMGVTGPVTSPTFGIVRVHEGEHTLVHVDAYRLSDPDEEDLGLVTGAAGDERIMIVEWPEAAGGGLGPPSVDVEMRHVSPTERLVLLRAEDAALAEPLAAACDDVRARHRLPEPEPGGPGGR